MTLSKTQKAFLKNLLKGVVNDSTYKFKKLPGSLAKGEVLGAYIEKLAGVRLKRLIRYPETRKEIEINFKNTLAFLEKEGFNCSSFDLNRLINGDEEHLLTFLFRTTNFYLTKSFSNKDVRKWLNNTCAKEGVRRAGSLVEFSERMDFEALRTFLSFAGDRENKEQSFSEAIEKLSSKGIPSCIPKLIEEGEKEKEIKEFFGNCFSETEPSHIYLNFVRKKLFEKEDMSAKEDEEIEKLKRERRILEEKNKIKEEKKKLRRKSKDKVVEHKKEKDDSSKKIESPQKETQKFETSQEGIRNELVKINELIKKGQEEDNRLELLNTKPDPNPVLSLAVDSSLTHGGNLKDIKAVVYGPLYPGFFKKNFSAGTTTKAKTNPLIFDYSALQKVRSEFVQKIEDLQDGRYLIIHKLLRKGVYLLSIILWGREISVSPLFMLLDGRGGFWLRPSGNSVSKINAAELETGKHALEGESLLHHREALLQGVSSFVGEHLVKEHKADALRAQQLVVEGAKDLAERQNKEQKKLKRLVENTKKAMQSLEEQMGAAAIVSLKGEFDETTECLKSFFENRKKIFLENFKEVISLGYSFQSLAGMILQRNKTVRVKIAGFAEGFLSLHIDTEKTNFNKNTVKIEFVEKNNVIKLQCEGKNYSLKTPSTDVGKYFYKGFKLLSLT